MSGWLTLEFADPSLEEAFQEECLHRTERRGLSVAATLSAIGVGMLITIGWWPKSNSARLVRRNVTIVILALGMLALFFKKAPKHASRWYNPVLLLLSLHWIVLVSLMTDGAPAHLQSETVAKWRPGMIAEPSGSLLVSGSLVGVIVFARPTLRWCLLYINLAVPLYTLLSLVRALPAQSLFTEDHSLTWSLTCFFGRAAALLYTTAALLFLARRDEEQRERHRFAVFYATRHRLQAERQWNRELQERQRELAQLAMALEHGPSSSTSLDSTQRSATLPAAASSEGSLAEAVKAKPSLSKLPTMPPRRLTVPAPSDMTLGSEAAFSSESSVSSAAAPEDAAAPVQAPSPPPAPPRPPPNEWLASSMFGRQADELRIRRMAKRIRHPQYMLLEFFEDCVASFPELSLFFQEGQDSMAATPSGRTAEAEYQRTIGALFAVYWLLRLEEDGRVSFCYGVDEQWLPDLPQMLYNCPARRRRMSCTSAPDRDLPSLSFCRAKSDGAGMDFARTPRRNSIGALPDLSVDRAGSFPGNRGGKPAAAQQAPTPPNTSFFKMSNDEKRASFLSCMDWTMFEDLVQAAGCSCSTPCSTDRIVALLCLTAIHDIMKIPALLPVVQPEHAPYHGYAAGDRIWDHDVALSYVIEHFPELMPSFSWLSPSQQRAILFTQSKMHFNHGWFVQAEAPPGAMLSGFKAALRSGADAQDIGLYFLHWITDLAGAEATPLGGAEKFVLKFPHAVLASFLWSIPFLGKLQVSSETEVVEAYLQARWRALAPELAVPVGEAAVACMRLAVMAQGDLKVINAFDSLPAEDRCCLASELSRTGCLDQRYAACGGQPAEPGGPALLVYYGPALLQKHAQGTEEDMGVALHVLAGVLRAARQLWPLEEASEGSTATIQIGALKADSLQNLATAPGGRPRELWVLVRHNKLEGSVELARASRLNGLHEDGSLFKAIDFGTEPDGENAEK